MTPQEAHAQAVERIRRARESEAVLLDLGDLPLDELTKELGQLPHLQVLSLGGRQPTFKDQQIRWEYRGKCPRKQFADVSCLANLTGLQSLDLSTTAVSNVAALAKLTGLQWLDLSRTAVSDASALANLIGLRELRLCSCEQLSDVSCLANLTGLQSLDLSGTAVSDVSALAGLAGLQSLSLFETAVSDVSALAGLAGLRKLKLWKCEQLSDLSCLAGLAGLELLDLDNCYQLQSFVPLRPLLENLETLYVFGCRFSDLPAEVCGERLNQNVIEEVRAYYADLDRGALTDAEVKLFVLGNGGVGKTQLSRRLCGQPYDETVSTTHGVLLDGFTIEPSGPLPPVRVNLWDFGGQDVYHGSHALFLEGHAVFLILWHPDFEHGEYEEHGVPMRRHPLSYWLDYVRSLAEDDTPVLLLQARCDQRTDKRPLPDVDLEGLAVRTLEVSARTGRGLAKLNEEIREAVSDLLSGRPPYQIGRVRAVVRDRLRQMLKEGRRTLERAEFDALCEEEGGVSSTEALLAFLHRSGVLFYRRGLFGDRVILDQQWALQAIYTLLDRSRTLPMLRNHGRFTRRDLEALVWGDYSKDEQLTFLGMMEKCHICFRTCKRSHDGEEDEWEYAAPDLLPELSEVQRSLLAGRVPRQQADAAATARYRFLHEGVLRGLLSRIGTRAGANAVYWKYGCWFYEEKTDCKVMIESAWDDGERRAGAGRVTFKAWGGRPQEVLEPLLQALGEMTIGRPPEVSQSWPEMPSRGRPAFEEADTPVIVTALDRLVPAPPPDDGPKVVAISYAHGDDASEAGRQRGRIVEEAHDCLTRWKYAVHRDEDQLKNGDIIQDFMRTLGRSARVFVVLSEKYLKSVYCMTELFYVYSFSLGDKRDFVERVAPVLLDDVRIDSWRERVQWAEYWEREYQEMEERNRHLGEPDRELLNRIRLWHAAVGNMLCFINDMLTVRGYDAIRADDFRVVREMLERPRQPR